MIINIVASIVLAATSVVALPQALCGAHHTYLNTQTGHNPCDLASYVAGGGVKAADSPFPDLDALGRTSYPVPSGSSANPAQCNQVFYNLASACAACQGSAYSWPTWTEWTANCGTVSSAATAILMIPDGIPVPNWAFIPPRVTNDTFSAIDAFREKEANAPDSFFPTLVIKESNVCTEPALSKGGIAGVAIGGIAALALVVIAALLFRRRKETKAVNTHLVRTGSATSSVEGIMRQKPEAV